MSDTIPRSQFSTHALRAHDHFSDNDVYDAWVEAMSAFFRPDAITDPQLKRKLGIRNKNSGLIDAYLFPGLMSVQVATSGYRFNRSATEIATDGKDGIAIQFWKRGAVYAQGKTVSSHAEAGDLHIVDFSREGEALCTPFENYTLVLPRESLLDCGLNLDALHFSKISGDTPSARLLRRHMYELHREAPNMDQAESVALVAPTIEMIRAVLTSDHELMKNASTLYDRNELLEIRHFIDNRLHDDKLCPEMIAVKLNISRSKLYRLTKPLGGVKRFIENRRLRRAFQRLAMHGRHEISIKKLAYDLGFNSEDRFRKAFKRTFSMTPSYVREVGSQAYFDYVNYTTTNCDATMPMGDMLYKRWLNDMLC